VRTQCVGVKRGEREKRDCVGFYQTNLAQQTIMVERKMKGSSLIHTQNINIIIAACVCIDFPPSFQIMEVPSGVHYGKKISDWHQQQQKKRKI
jgi:hypothetical protein